MPWLLLQEELLSTMALIQLPRFAALGGELLWQNSVKLLGAHCGVDATAMYVKRTHKKHL